MAGRLFLCVKTVLTVSSRLPLFLLLLSPAGDAESAGWCAERDVLLRRGERCDDWDGHLAHAQGLDHLRVWRARQVGQGRSAYL